MKLLEVEKRGKKFRNYRSGSNPQILVCETRTLPLDHTPNSSIWGVKKPSDLSEFFLVRGRLSFISHCSEQYNDIQLVYNEEYYQTMVKEGVDPVIARHVAHLFIRDPIPVNKEKLDQDDKEETDHFENIQSTNWQTMRFKPPPPSYDPSNPSNPRIPRVSRSEDDYLDNQ